ncbi:MAG: hypothetical protein KatS3mg100_011 [Candidatus Parcubacteria bacterium]|nr:MAG: hypothetical protein KatS3mg100_011 [Candidatus Parcubacteria bacterium]
MADAPTSDPTQRDLLFFGGILLALFIVWLASGGPQRPEAKQPVIIVANPESATSTEGGSPRSFRDPLATPQGRWLQKLFSLFPGRERRTDLLGRLLRSSLGRRGRESSDPDREFLAIALSPEATTSVAISGWRLVSRVSGATAVVPHGVEDLRPQGNRVQGPITLMPGDIAFLTTGASPVGVSFLTNRCTGYLAQEADWVPPLRRECPNPASELKEDPQAVAWYGAACLEYLERLAPCAAAPAEPLPEGFAGRCDDLVAQSYSYAGCYARERPKETFWGNEWRIFFGLDRQLWSNRHDIIDLVDEQGRVVASVRY